MKKVLQSHTVAHAVVPLLEKRKKKLVGILIWKSIAQKIRRKYIPAASSEVHAYFRQAFTASRKAGLEQVHL